MGMFTKRQLFHVIFKICGFKFYILLLNKLDND